MKWFWHNKMRILSVINNTKYHLHDQAWQFFSSPFWLIFTFFKAVNRICYHNMFVYNYKHMFIFSCNILKKEIIRWEDGFRILVCPFGSMRSKSHQNEFIYVDFFRLLELHVSNTFFWGCIFSLTMKSILLVRHWCPNMMVHVCWVYCV
jgi:hypothetical protein